MSKSVDIDLDLGLFSLVIIAIALLEFWKLGLPWYVAVAVGILASVLAGLGIVPVFGQIIYWLVMNLVMNVLGVSLSWTFWAGLVVSVMYSLAIVLVLSISNVWW